MDSCQPLTETLIASNAISMTSEEQAYHVLTQLSPFNELKDKVFNIADDYSAIHRKNAETARQLFESGSNYLEDNDYQRAVDSLTRAIRCCPFPDDTESDANLLANCYRLRSQAFNKLENIENELHDESQYLYLTLADDEVMVGNTDDSDDYIDLREAYIADQLENIISVIDASVALKTDETKGRYFAASRPIPTDTEVLVEKPLAAILHHHRLSFFCSNCHKPATYQFWPCRTCDEVVFCDRECADIAMAKFHRHECGIAGLLAQYGTASYLAYRLLTRVGCRVAVELNGELDESDMTGKWVVDSDRPVVALVDGYKAFLTLYSHINSLDVADECFSLIISIYLAFFLRYANAVDDHIHQLPAFVAFVLMIQSHIHKLIVNSFEYTDTENRYGLGSAVMYLGSIFSHSCDPNVVYNWRDGSLVFTTARDIDVDQELFISYGPVYGEKSVTERRSKLSKVYNFLCQCWACVTESANRRGLRCPHCGDGVVSYGADAKQAKCLACGESHPNLDVVLGVLDSAKMEINSLLERIESNVEVDASLERIDSLVDQMLVYIRESSEDIVGLKQYLPVMCSAIQRYDLAAKYGLRNIPQEFDIECYPKSFKSVQQLTQLADDYFSYLTQYNVIDKQKWTQGVAIHEFLVRLVERVLSGDVDYDERYELSEILRRKSKAIRDLKVIRNTFTWF